MSRVARKTAVSLSEAIQEYLKVAKLSAGLNTQRIFAAWDAASGAGRYTVRRFFRDGRLYITVDSSVVRSQLSFQRDVLIEKINALLAQDELFTRDDARVGIVKELILK
ncbi:Protein of unknown function [Bacteroidales bacterium WCE2004]|nr:DUF721 domain-containing protein [Bacteroidales bacterium]SKC38006.1 Protein of unknown function [Bacteroidales bacterium WCE2004]